MKPWIRSSLIALSGVLIALAGSYYWLIAESHTPSQTQYALDIAEVRRLAGSLEGDKPARIEVERVALFKFPATAVVAGDGWKMQDLPVYSYRLAYPHTSLIVDTALAKETGVTNLAEFDDAAYARMQQAMSQASMIFVTHEHMDHIGGVTNHPQLPNLLHALRLNREQVAHPEVLLPAKFPAHALDGYTPLTYERYLAVAPGVVLIRAPGHTPGSQMVYVTTADGKEFLLIGDVAWHWRNIDTQRERARLITWLMLKEDRHAVFGQLAALNRLHQAEPNIHIVPGHDATVVDPLIRDGVLKTPFSLAAAENPAGELPTPSP